MPIIVKISKEESPGEWAIIELQGDLESRAGGTFDSQFIGDLHYTRTDVPVLIVGHHILYGKEINLEKPFAVLEKQSSQLQRNIHGESETDYGPSTEYIIKAIIKKKLLFKTRPKPIIANVPKVI